VDMADVIEVPGDQPMQDIVEETAIDLETQESMYHIFQPGFIKNEY